MGEYPFYLEINHIKQQIIHGYSDSLQNKFLDPPVQWNVMVLRTYGDYIYSQHNLDVGRLFLAGRGTSLIILFRFDPCSAGLTLSVLHRAPAPVMFPLMPVAVQERRQISLEMQIMARYWRWCPSQWGLYVIYPTYFDEIPIWFRHFCDICW